MLMNYIKDYALWLILAQAIIIVVIYLYSKTNGHSYGFMEIFVEGLINLVYAIVPLAFLILFILCWFFPIEISMGLANQ